MRIQYGCNSCRSRLQPTVDQSLRDYLFIGHPKTGGRSAVIYSVTGTCRLLGVNPEGCLRWVLPRLAAATNKTATGLLPHDFARVAPAASELTHGTPTPLT